MKERRYFKYTTAKPDAMSIDIYEDDIMVRCYDLIRKEDVIFFPGTTLEDITYEQHESETYIEITKEEAFLELL